jgi:asparagine synthetase B (glutamine-hydrolysing)
MCGLIGGYTKGNFGFSGAGQKALEELLFMDTLRGPDSTGVCVIKNDYDVRVAKKASWAPSFLMSKAFGEIGDILFKSGKMFMGHNRKATVGNINSENAHPFIVQNELVLMHNGSLPSHKHLADTEVDSEAIAIYLHQHWDDAASPQEKANVLSKIGGAWALVWYDLRTEKLNIVRNAQRPLFIYKGASDTFWASDEDMLRCAAKRNNFHGNISAVPTYTVLSFSEKGLQEVVLPASSFFPPSQPKAITYSGPDKKTTYTAAGWVSKNAFKRIAKEWVGQTITFDLEGEVAINNMHSFYGESAGLEINHEIIGIVPSVKLLSEIEDNYGVAKGTVMSCTHNKTTGYITFVVKLLGASKYATSACH